MTTTTRNEAAERVRAYLEGNDYDLNAEPVWDLDDALRVERTSLTNRVDRRLLKGVLYTKEKIRAILDDEAQR